MESVNQELAHEDELRSHITDWQLHQQVVDRHLVLVWESVENAHHLVARRSRPQYGSLAEVKPQGVWRVMYVQANGLAEPGRRRHKLEAMMDLARRFDVDGIVLCEVGINWKAHRRCHRLDSWVSNFSEREVRASSSFNHSCPSDSLSQQGGTLVVLLHSLIQYAHKTAHDFRNLGCWASWMLCMNPLHRTRLVVAYCPGHVRRKGLKTVYQQHLRYIQSHNLQCSPYELFLGDLCSRLCNWRSDGDRILLFIDSNEDVINGRLGRSLIECPADLVERSHLFWPPGEPPNTYVLGSLPIDGIYSTPDIDITNILSLPFVESVGNHRTMITEITTLSALGQLHGNVVRPTTRRLTTKQSSSVKAYTAEVIAQCDIHNIWARTDALLLSTTSEGFPPTEGTIHSIQALHNQMDEIRICTERRCHRILKPVSSFSPPIQFWYDKIHASFKGRKSSGNE